MSWSEENTEASLNSDSWSNFQISLNSDSEQQFAHMRSFQRQADRDTNERQALKRQISHLKTQLLKAQEANKSLAGELEASQEKNRQLVSQSSFQDKQLKKQRQQMHYSFEKLLQTKKQLYACQMLIKVFKKLLKEDIKELVKRLVFCKQILQKEKSDRSLRLWPTVKLEINQLELKIFTDEIEFKQKRQILGPKFMEEIELIFHEAKLLQSECLKIIGFLERSS